MVLWVRVLLLLLCACSCLLLLSHWFPFALQCSAVNHHPTYWVGDYGSVSGADKMKAEIYQRGPIGCGISVTDKFEAYTGGIFSQFSLFPIINHEVSVSSVVILTILSPHGLPCYYHLHFMCSLFALSHWWQKESKISKFGLLLRWIFIAFSLWCEWKTFKVWFIKFIVNKHSVMACTCFATNVLDLLTPIVKVNSILLYAVVACIN